MIEESLNSGINICPLGWHVPTNSELTDLIFYLDPNVIGDFDNIAGGQLKTTGDIASGTGAWESPNTGATNSSGFSLLPSGGRVSTNGEFNSLGFSTRLWSTNESSNSNSALTILQHHNRNEVWINSESIKGIGACIRCIKD